MDLRLTFNMDAPSYDKFRPTYKAELFEDIIEYSHIDENAKALEIGIGTGQATLLFLKTGCAVTAIEIGDRMAQFSRKKFAEFKRFEVINQDFENVSLTENTYDLIYSASAFHWIPQETGLPKVYDLLKSGGLFAWFSNQPTPADEHTHIHEELQKVYSKYSEFFGGSTYSSNYRFWQEQAEKKRRNRTNTLREYGFIDVKDKIYYDTRTFNAEDYAALLSTYSNHKAMPEKIRLPFLKEIADVINGNGGRFTLSDIMILSMGKKQ